MSNRSPPLTSHFLHICLRLLHKTLYLLSAGVLFLNEAALPETDTISPLLLPEDSKLPLPSKQ